MSPKKPALQTAIRTSLRTSLWCFLALSTSACQQAEREANQAALGDLGDQMDGLSAQLDRSQSELAGLKQTGEVDRQSLTDQLSALSERIEALPETLASICPDDPPAASCDNVESVRRVVVAADKMLVGELEHVWIDPPGVTVVARIDTGATSSSLHAENVVPFERDGDDWVRFDMTLNENESVTLERQVARHARVIQQADPDGSRRPVVQMRVRLGDVQDTFEFTLADRSHLENEMILGRNFLADVTLVDVGRQFIQPRPSSQSGESR